ncbi:MAG TPA: TonB-dependent receptor plug domain-containing protein, partial [Planctomycetota bacterium]|nr:TonB-dependent receptor plug domain-containing protein [Planctomycetota bacterium]
MFRGLAMVAMLSFGWPAPSLAQDIPKPAPPPQETPKKDEKPSEAPKTQEVVVTGRSLDLTGVADSATEGKVGQKEIENRPLQRPGEVLETVPGLIVTEHSGDGKANQYYLRGFNLDHGTDFATWVNGMPINLPTNAHGQGYTDLSFLIPELIESIDFRKGPYYADEGDFSAAGAVHLDYFDRLEHGLATVTLGTNGYERAVAAQSWKAGEGDLLLAAEAFHYDGPWDVPENYVRQNAVLRYSEGDSTRGWNVTAMAYRGTWTSTDQVAKRAVESGRIDRFGTLDPSDGGKSHRYSLSGQWHSGDKDGMWRAHAYLVDYQLQLFSDFTYFLKDPVSGDQFEQAERRSILGGDVAYDLFSRWIGQDQKTTFGVQTRNDWIRDLGLSHTKDRQVLSTTSDDDVVQDSVALYVSNNTQWTDWLRSIVGLRGDYDWFNVKSTIPQNAGTHHQGIASPKASLVLGPWQNTEFYLNGGLGFHSNDGRGTTLTLDPSTRTPVSPVTALVRAKGADVGVRTTIVPGLQSTVSVFLLDIDSELVFLGDAGTTQPSRPSRRYGVEFANYYTPVSGLTFDADFATAHARFTDHAPAGNYIPGAVEGVLEVGGTLQLDNGLLASLRLRYFGPRPLIEDDSVRSNSTTLVNGRLGYKWK